MVRAMLNRNIGQVEGDLAKAIEGKDIPAIAALALRLGALKEGAGLPIESSVIPSLNTHFDEKKLQLVDELRQALTANIRSAYAKVIQEQGRFKIECKTERIIISTSSEGNFDAYFFQNTEISFPRSIKIHSQFSGELEAVLNDYGVQSDFSIDLNVDPDDGIYSTENVYDFGNLSFSFFTLSEAELLELLDKVRTIILVNVISSNFD